VHRDVSPHNVLVGTDGVARLVDFGIAKAMGRVQTTRDGQLKGKIAYMAPEQIDGQASRTTDVYAAAACIWEALTAKRLFYGESEIAVMKQVLQAEVKPPSTYVPGLDATWDEIVLRGLARNPEHRYASAREMAFAIEARLTIARATEVGAWVECHAREALARRVADVQAIERASDIDLAYRPDLATLPDSPLELSGSIGATDAPTRMLLPQAAPHQDPSGSTSSRIHALSSPASVRPRSRSVAAIIVVGVGAAIAAATTLVVSSMPAQPGTKIAAPPLPVVSAALRPDPEPRLEPSREPAPSVASASPGASSTTNAAVAASALSSMGVLASARTIPPAPARPPRAVTVKPAPAPAGPKGTSLGGILDTRR
jgi:serine/threonine-protein kinase